MYRLITAGCVLALGLFMPSLTAGEKTADNPAVRKLNRDIPRHKEFLNRIEQNKGAGDVIFLGDSITHGWESQSKIWQEHFGAFKPVNLGIGGDQTGHVLWRITDGHELDRLNPKAAVIMIGTNNIGGHTASQIAGGIKAIVEELKRQKPHIKVLVLGVFPRGNAADAELSPEQIMQGIKPINAELEGEPGSHAPEPSGPEAGTTAADDSGREAEQESRRDQRDHRQAGGRRERVLQAHRQGVPGQERRPVGRDHAGLPAPERQGLRHLGQGDQGRYCEARPVGPSPGGLPNQVTRQPPFGV